MASIVGQSVYLTQMSFVLVNLYTLQSFYPSCLPLDSVTGKQNFVENIFVCIPNYFEGTSHIVLPVFTNLHSL